MSRELTHEIEEVEESAFGQYLPLAKSVYTDVFVTAVENYETLVNLANRP
jgi:hypothetical protein